MNPLSSLLETAAVPDFKKFPSTRYQGSKRKVLPFIWSVIKELDFTTCLDLYAGTSSVSLLLRMANKSVYANDYLLYNHAAADFLLNAQKTTLEKIRIEDDLPILFAENYSPYCHVQKQYPGIFFTDAENGQIDAFCHNLAHINPQRRNMYIYLMGQAMLMKRPYNLFHRANLNMRTRSVTRTFGNTKTWETSFQAHIQKLFQKLQAFPFNGPQGIALNHNTLDLESIRVEPDLIYLDPPYLNHQGVGVNYADFYHFLEGLVDYELYNAGNKQYPHQPLVDYQTAWHNEANSLWEFERIMNRWPRSQLVISYRGDGQPSTQAICELLERKQYQLRVHQIWQYKYALSKNQDSTEDLIVAIPSKMA